MHGHAVAEVSHDVPAVGRHLPLIGQDVREHPDVRVGIQRLDFALVLARNNEAVFQILAGLQVGSVCLQHSNLCANSAYVYPSGRLQGGTSGNLGAGRLGRLPATTHLWQSETI